MQKTTTVEIDDADAPAIQTELTKIWRKMERVNRRMSKRRATIEKLKKSTRATLDRLDAA